MRNYFTILCHQFNRQNSKILDDELFLFCSFSVLLLLFLYSEGEVEVLIHLFCVGLLIYSPNFKVIDQNCEAHFALEGPLSLTLI